FEVDIEEHIQLTTGHGNRFTSAVTVEDGQHILWPRVAGDDTRRGAIPVFTALEQFPVAVGVGLHRDVITQDDRVLIGKGAEVFHTFEDVFRHDVNATPAGFEQVVETGIRLDQV